MREFFTLRETEREARALPEHERGVALRRFALAFQKRDAAETLWPRGSCAEALKLARASLDAASESLDGLEGDAAVKPPWLARAHAILSEARKQVADAPLPEIEADARPEHEATFRALIDATLDLEATIGPRLDSPAQLARLRRNRIATSVVGVTAFVALAAWLLHTPETLRATASGQLSPSYGAEKVIDGDAKSAWIGPDQGTSWVDVTFSKTHPVRALRVVASNPPYQDRDVRDVRIEAYLGDRQVHAIDFTFPEPTSPEPMWVDVPLGAPACDRIRIEAKTFYKLGPSIAEIELK